MKLYLTDERHYEQWYKWLQLCTIFFTFPSYLFISIYLLFIEIYMCCDTYYLCNPHSVSPFKQLSELDFAIYDVSCYLRAV